MDFVSKAMRFGVTTVLSFLINAGGTVLLHEVAGLPAELAYALALVTVFLANFFLFRHFVYRNPSPRVSSQMVHFAMATGTFRGCEYLTFLLIHSWLGVHYLVAIIGISVVFTCVKFLFYSKFIFGGAPVRRRTDVETGVSCPGNRS